MAKRTWLKSKELDAAMEAAGATYCRDPSRRSEGYWWIPALRGTGYVKRYTVQNFIRDYCPSLQDLPKVLLDDELGHKSFGRMTWHDGVKPVLASLLEGR